MPVTEVAIKVCGLCDDLETVSDYSPFYLSKLMFDGVPCPIFCITCDSCGLTLSSLILHANFCSTDEFRKELVADLGAKIDKRSWKVTCRKCLGVRKTEIEEARQPLRQIQDPACRETAIADWQGFGGKSLGPVEVLVVTQDAWLPPRDSEYWIRHNIVKPYISRDPLRLLDTSLELESFRKSSCILVLAELHGWIVDHMMTRMGHVVSYEASFLLNVNTVQYSLSELPEEDWAAEIGIREWREYMATLRYWQSLQALRVLAQTSIVD